MNEQEFQSEFYTLTDEDGNETEFEVIGSAEINGIEYFAMVPSDSAAGSDGMIEYVLLKKEKDESGEEMFVTIDDDDEFDRVADYFDDMFDSEEEVRENAIVLYIPRFVAINSLAIMPEKIKPDKDKPETKNIINLTKFHFSSSLGKDKNKVDFIRACAIKNKIAAFIFNIPIAKNIKPNCAEVE